jgi:2-dehydro-3-deoxy-D-arabinonate dehydratase
LVWRSPTGSLHTIDETLADLLAEGVTAVYEARREAQSTEPLEGAYEIVCPIDQQEVWACGVTYERSRVARVAEAMVSDPYDLVYNAQRPELFLKAPPYRVPRPNAALRIRRDSTWDVPEPELALVISANKEVVGYLVADDLSSRSIEAENPLYLPQAKLYDDSIGLSDAIVLARDLEVDPKAMAIELLIRRDGATLYAGSTSTAAMRRSYEELVECLFTDLSHPYGVVLLTGTGIVPPDQITLEDGDNVQVSIEGVGSLHHSVYRDAPATVHGASGR